MRKPCDVVFKAISSTGDECIFGVASAAKAWAKGGRVEEIEIRVPVELCIVPQGNVCETCQSLAMAVLADPVDARSTSAAIAGLEMALSQADAMIERQQHVMQRAMDAWDTTTYQKNHDGQLWQCMEDLRGECVDRRSK